MEPYNARFRQECLSEHWFLSVADAQERVELWRQDYDRVRPQSSLDNRMSGDFVQQAPDADLHGAGQGTNATGRTTQRQRQEVCLTG
jgi:putative transposase